MKLYIYLSLGIVLAYGVHLNAIDQHPFIIRLHAQIVSQLQKFDKAVEKLQTALVSKQIEVCDTELVLDYLAQAHDTVYKALNPSCHAQPTKMFLLPTYLETAFERTIDRWILNPKQVPSDSELQIIPRYAYALVKILSYVRQTNKENLERSFLSIRSVYLTLFSDCVVYSIILSLYTLKNKRLLNCILQRLYMLHAVLEEYSNYEALISADPSSKEAVLAYSVWTKEVIKRILSSEISTKNPQYREPWRSKVEPTIKGVISSLGKKTMLDKVLEYIVNRVTGLTITKPCFDYINSLIRCIRGCSRVLPR